MFLILSILFFALLHLPWFRKRRWWNTLKERAAWALGLSLFAAGALHLSVPAVFAAIVPDYMPSPQKLVYAGGAALMTGSLGVIWKRVRRFTSYGVIGMLLAFLPANINLAMHGAELPNAVGTVPPNHWLAWSSVPMQFVYMAWAWLVGRKR
ncbi:MAG: hypothetical protein AB8H80_08255 [Planctomycetota bacterium]